MAYMGFAALVILITLVGGYSLAVFQALRDQGDQESLTADLAQASIGTQFISDHMGSLLDRLKDLSARKVFRQAMQQQDQDELLSLLKPLGASSREVESVFLANAQGGLILSLPPLLSLAEPHPGLPKGFSAGPGPVPWVSPVHPGLKPPHLPVVTLSVPILDPEGALLGYLGLSQSRVLGARFPAHFLASGAHLPSFRPARLPVAGVQQATEAIVPGALDPGGARGPPARAADLSWPAIPTTWCAFLSRRPRYRIWTGC
ncbi:hypothetical protein DFAR_4010012 [Desulfarculales bacterium]